MRDIETLIDNVVGSSISLPAVVIVALGLLAWWLL